MQCFANALLIFAYLSNKLLCLFCYICQVVILEFYCLYKCIVLSSRRNETRSNECFPLSYQNNWNIALSGLSDTDTNQQFTVCKNNNGSFNTVISFASTFYARRKQASERLHNHRIHPLVIHGAEIHANVYVFMSNVL